MESRNVVGKQVEAKPGYDIGLVIHYPEAIYRVMAMNIDVRTGKRMATLVQVEGVAVSIFCPESNAYVSAMDWVIAK